MPGCFVPMIIGMARTGVGDAVKMDALHLTTIVVAMYGALLSTDNAIIRRIEKNPELKVGVRGSFAPSNDQMIHCYSPTAANIGIKRVTISSHGSELPTGHTFFPFDILYSDFTTPHELAQGKSYTLLVNTKYIAKALKDNSFSGKIKLKGFFRDQTDVTYRSKSRLSNIDEF